MSPYAFALTWIVQAAVLGLASLALPRLFRVRHPSVLEQWWAWGALAVVAMPVLPVLLPARATAPPTAVAAFFESTTEVMTAVPGPSLLLTPLMWVAVVWVSGIVVRGLWLGLGVHRLRQRAATGAPVVDDPALDQARALAATHATNAVTQRCLAEASVIAAADAGPCAFGWLRPTVLVPRSLAVLPDDQRLAVYLHELLHVVRLDVGRSYVDEAWRSAWWWQPAVWWMLSRLRLARELQVDRAVVAATGMRRAYVEALLWCGARRQTLALSPQVGGGRHALVHRVALLCEEGEMSRLRQWSAYAGMAFTFAVVIGAASLHSPLRAAAQGPVASVEFDQGPLERTAVRPTLDAPAPRRVVAVEPIWNDDGVAYRFRVHLVIDAEGRVAESRAVGVSGIDLAPDGPAPQVAAARDAAITAVRQWRFEPPAHAPMLIATDVSVGRQADGAESYSPAQPTSSPRTSSRQPIRVTGNVAPPTKVVHVNPVYPQVAMDAKVTGVVMVDATIDPDGSVSHVDIVRSIPLLDQAAVDAVKQWTFTPTLLNGEPVPVIVTITVNFTLQ